VPIEAGITFLPTQSIEATRRFYEDVCGLKLIQDQGVCHIYEVVLGSYWGFCEHLSPIEPATSVMLTIVTEDVDQWFQNLQSRGVTCDGEPRRNEKFGIYHFFADAPDGYRLEVQRFDDPAWNTTL
jgi:catechol 2,3-dioxygenase-like lactoylglutathione lyase family enzyme